MMYIFAVDRIVDTSGIPINVVLSKRYNCCDQYLLLLIINNWFESRVFLKEQKKVFYYFCGIKKLFSE